MQIAEYISKLLYQNDCVIIPEMGGFVTNYTSAKIHPINHTFYPPSKSILFNTKLLNDDGLLINAISIGENIAYSEAKNEVTFFVNRLLHILNEGNRFILEKIGIFSKDVEGALLFEPDTSINYLESSFGLPVFVSPPILRKSIQKRLEKKFIDRKPVPVGYEKSRKRNWAYLALIPILLLIGWFVFDGNFNTNNTQESNLIPIIDTENLNNNAGHIENKVESKPIAPIKDSDFGDSETINRESEKVVNDPINEVKEPILPIKKYYIIGGAFQFEDNAEKLVATLRKDGYNAEPAGLNLKGLFLVSYYNSEDKSEALVNLAMIRRDSNPSAWLLKK